MIGLRKDEFQKWLRQRLHEPVGESQEAFKCPLACFLKQKHEVSFLVACSRIENNISHKRHKPPKWAQNFIAAVDLGRREPTGKDCLNYLK